MNTVIANELIIRATSKLDELGIQKNLLGFRYLRKAILLTYQKFGYVASITTKLYPEIATENETTPSKVERAMRHAIENAYYSNNKAMLNYGKKPCNGLLIAEIADRLRIEDGIV